MIFLLFCGVRLLGISDYSKRLSNLFLHLKGAKDIMDRAAIYCRLSKEDFDKLNKGDDSESIQNGLCNGSRYADL